MPRPPHNKLCQQGQIAGLFNSFCPFVVSMDNMRRSNTESTEAEQVLTLSLPVNLHLVAVALDGLQQQWQQQWEF